MRNIVELYKSITAFAESYLMIDEFKVIGSIEDIDVLNYKPRTVYFLIQSTDISRENNLVRTNCLLIVLDKCVPNDTESFVLSTQENVFVISQIQDFILSEDNVTEFYEIDTTTSRSAEFTATAASCEFDVYFERDIWAVDCSTFSSNTTAITGESLQIANETWLGGANPQVRVVPSVGNATDIVPVLDEYMWLSSTSTNITFQYKIRLDFLTRTWIMGMPYENNVAYVYTGSLTLPSTPNTPVLLAQGQTLRQFIQSTDLFAFVADDTFIMTVEYVGDTHHLDALGLFIVTTPNWFNSL